MKIQLTDGTSIEVFGAENKRYETPEKMLCGPNCEYLRKNGGRIPIGCSIGGKNLNFPQSSLNEVNSSGDIVPFRQPECIRLDPCPQDMDCLWILVVSRIYQNA